MTRTQYQYLRWTARFERHRLDNSNETDGNMRAYERLLAAYTAAKARVPGGMGRYGNDPLRLPVGDRLYRVRAERRRVAFLAARVAA